MRDACHCCGREWWCGWIDRQSVRVAPWRRFWWISREKTDERNPTIISRDFLCWWQVEDFQYAVENRSEETRCRHYSEQLVNMYLFHFLILRFTLFVTIMVTNVFINLFSEWKYEFLCYILFIHRSFGILDHDFLFFKAKWWIWWSRLTSTDETWKRWWESFHYLVYLQQGDHFSLKFLRWTHSHLIYIYLSCFWFSIITSLFFLEKGVSVQARSSVDSMSLSSIAQLELSMIWDRTDIAKKEVLKDKKFPFHVRTTKMKQAWSV